MGLKQYLCIDCWHEILADGLRRPQSIHWSDGHVCNFKSPEDIDTSLITKFDVLIETLGRGCDITRDDFPLDDLRVAYEEEVKLMCRYGLKASLPKLILHPFRVAGSQHIAEFEVKDLTKVDNPSKINFHMQNTSQWVYAGCILYDERDQRVSRHH